MSLRETNASATVDDEDDDTNSSFFSTWILISPEDKFEKYCYI